MITKLNGQVKDCVGGAEESEKARHQAEEAETLLANANKQLETTKAALQKAQQESDNARKEASKAQKQANTSDTKVLQLTEQLTAAESDLEAY